ncbi:MAG: stage III sporulation protein AF [Clostridiales bacterium]|nr:stage III sporulation protein AF [Clostridiales bacterium]
MFEWIRRIAGFLVLQSLGKTLLPSRKYEVYYQTFTGILLAMMIAAPILEAGGLDQLVLSAAERIQSEWDLREGGMEERIDDWEGIQEDQLEEILEEQAVQKMEEIARESQAVMTKCQLTWEDVRQGTLKNAYVELDHPSGQSREACEEMFRRQFLRLFSDAILEIHWE